MIDAGFALAIVLLFINIILFTQRIPKDFPLLNIIVGIFTFVLCIGVFYPNENINIWFTVFVAIVGLSQMVVQVLGTEV